MSERDAPLRMSPDAFRRAGHALVDLIAERLAAIPDGPVTPGESPLDVQHALHASMPLPEEGCDADTGGVNFMMEQSNRGMRSVGLDLGNPKGRELLM
jgi:hypothetical protein